jgi:VanZ family protein
MRKRTLLALWLLGILFPMAWFGQFFPRFRGIFNATFSPEWVHWVMHAALYAGLAVLVMSTFDLRPSMKALGWVLVISLGVGIIQEGLQLFSDVQILRWNSLLDLGVDSGGTLAGFLVVTGIRKLREKQVSSRG